MAALIQASSLGSRTKAAERLLDKAARKITYHQRRNAQARHSHTKTTRRRLRELGIRLRHFQKNSWSTGGGWMRMAHFSSPVVRSSQGASFLISAFVRRTP